MSRRVRNRVTATVLGGFLLGAALLTTGTANAEQVAGGGRQVVFAGGGVLGRSCQSSPSVESMLVPADGKVRLVNRTGHGAQLRLNGKSQGSIPDDGSTEVVFRRGTTAVTLDPSCAVPDQTTPVLVTTTPPPLPSLPGPIPTPADASTDSGLPPPPATTIDPSTPDQPADSASAIPDPIVVTRSATKPTRRPSSVRPHTSRAHRVAAQAATTAARSMPQSGAASRGKTRTPSGTAGAVVPAFTGMPPGDDRTNLPGVPKLDLPAPVTTAAPESPAGAPSGMVAAEPVAAMRPLPESQPIGLLAVIAMVCVLGVAIGVIRAMVSERASRASVA